MLVTTYGAVGDGQTSATRAIQKAIDACYAQGGGRVRIPAGRFLCETVYLKSNIELHLEAGAVLLGSNRLADYPMQPPTGTRMDDFLSRAIVVARNQRNISISGPGTIDGQGRLNQNDFLDDPAHAHAHRPMLIWFDECQSIRVESITLVASGFWTQTYSRCRGGQIRGVTVTDSVNNNNDGCDIVDSHDLIVEDCDIDCIDDGICLKAFTQAGCSDIIIRNNRVKSLCNAIKTGTDSSGDGFQRLLIQNNVVYQVGRAGLALESTDGAILRDVRVENLKMEVVGTPIFIKLGDRLRPTYDAAGKPVIPDRPGIIENIHIQGVHATVDNETIPQKAEYTIDEKRLHGQTRPRASSITGLPGFLIENITLEDVNIEVLGGYETDITLEHVLRTIPEASKKYPNPDMMGILPAYGLYCRHARGLSLKNVQLISRMQDPRPAMVLDDVHDTTLARVSGQNVFKTAVVSVKQGCTRISFEPESKD